MTEIKYKVIVTLALSVLFVYSAFCQEPDRESLNGYVDPGLELHDTRPHRLYPTERETALGAASMLKNRTDFFSPFNSPLVKNPHAGDSKYHLRIDEYRIGKPVTVRFFSGDMTSFYGTFIPVPHPEEGLRMLMLSDRYYDNKTKKYFMKTWPIINFTPKPHRPAYHLIGEREAGKLIEKYFPVKVRNPVIGIQGFFPTRLGSIDAWFCYVRIDEGFRYDGRTVDGMFVLPYAVVHDAKKVSLEDLATKESADSVIHALIHERFYTFEGEDVDPYELEKKLLSIDPDLMGGRVQRSDFPKNMTLTPLIPENRPPDTGDFVYVNPLIEIMRKAEGNGSRKRRRKRDDLIGTIGPSYPIVDGMRPGSGYSVFLYDILTNRSSSAV